MTCVKGGCFTLLYHNFLYTFADWETNSRVVFKCVLLVHDSRLTCFFLTKRLCVCVHEAGETFAFVFLYINMLVDFQESHP